MEADPPLTGLGIARTDLHFAAVYLRHGKRTLALRRILRAVREMERAARGMLYL